MAAGLAFALVRTILWGRPPAEGRNYLVQFAAWAFAWAPGLLALTWRNTGVRARRNVGAASGKAASMNAAAYAELNVVVLMAGAIELRQNWYRTAYRKMLPVPHPLALALYSNASMAAEAAAALHVLGISREQISVVAHSHADARTLADRMDATPGVDLEDRERRDA